jgi:hypothetical protein
MNEAKKAVFEIQKQMYEDREFFGKSATNPFYNSKYVPLPSILRVLVPKLLEKGCMLHHESEPTGGNQVVVYSVVTHIETDDQFRVPATIPMEKLNPQEGGKATTYGRRYSTMPQFGIPEYDDDGEGAMKRAEKKGATQLSGCITATQQYELKKLYGSIQFTKESGADFMNVLGTQFSATKFAEVKTEDFKKLKKYMEGLKA